MRVKRAMTAAIMTASPNDAMRRVARLMKDSDTGFVPIVEHGAVIGVVTDRDMVVRGIAGDAASLEDLRARDVMTVDIVTIDEDEPLERAAHLMAERGVRRLLVVSQGELGGVLSYGDLEQALHAEGLSAKEATLGVTRH